MDIIIFHQNCPDGWCAAFIAKMKYPESALMGLNHGLPESELESLFSFVEGKDVLMVDYSLRTRELNDRLNSVAKSFRILDHHKTAQAALEGASYATFDMKRSGAGLAWDYLFGKDAPMYGGEVFLQSRPWWVNYTEDQDLWNWALPDSQEINAWLMVQPRNIEVWNYITTLDTLTAKALGLGVRQYIEYYTRSVVAEAQEGVLMFEGRNYRTAVLNIPYAGVSEAGNALVKAGYEIGLAWFERGDGITQFSLRSNKGAEGGGVDVSVIAKYYGGGGHRNAAGFQLSLQEGRDLVDKILGRPNYLLKLAAENLLNGMTIQAKAENETLRSPGGCV
jgi:oligoribonuclease NrnB/cAMP/cGMP phosphodiesterase (DHH superfamily)